MLKSVIKKYCPDKYAEVFRIADSEIDNYVKYSANLRQVDITASKFKKCSAEDFCKYICGILKDVVPQEEDKPAFDDILHKLELNTLCPKQVTSDNRVIPYQLYYIELKKILENAADYLPFLKQTDEYGSVSDKILSIMTYRIPYYVGPINSHSSHAWIERKLGKIYPWNFSDMVDLDESEEKFIRRMTAKCTYCAGEDVLPKNSLLYCKFTVLDEINNICVNGERISPEIKQGIYENVFMKHKKVTLKKIHDYLVKEGLFNEKTDKLDGIDITVKSNLKPWIDFGRLMTAGVLTEEEAEDIIKRITITTDKKRLKSWLKMRYGKLSENDILYICGLGYKDYGRLSRKFLAEISEIDAKSGEIIGESIINSLWSGSENHMELLSDRHGYKHQLEQMNTVYYRDKHSTLEERLSEMYIPTAVRRAVIRTLDIAKELNRLTGTAPAKIFIEMARNHTNDNKGKRTVSRKDKLREYLKKCADDENLLKELEMKSEEELRGDKLYLYFMQLGKCMYSGEPIDLDMLTTKAYDIDHIFPQSKLKDDSIDNRVLCKSEINGKKGDNPIEKTIRDNRRGFWTLLHKNGLISDKKYERLTRSTPFTDEELAGFINRQLVETRQSTKAVAALLKEIFPQTDIVYVKAGLVSDFRHTFDMLKCREINDLHHAKDAYLNIVMGQVYDIKFTRNPLNFIKVNCGNNRNYSMKLDSLLGYDIECGGVVAWQKDKSIVTVKRQMSKNNITCVRYCYTRKGELFNMEPERKNHGVVERKKGLSVAKYGGYNNTSAACFVLVKYYGENSAGLVLMPLEVMYVADYLNDNSFAQSYCKRTLEEITGISIDRVEFPLGKRFIKINTLIDIDGFRATIAQKSNKGKTIVLASTNSLILDKEQHDYVKKLTNFVQKNINNNNEPNEEHDKITFNRNESLYDILLDKLNNKIYSVKFKKTAEKVKFGREKFRALTLRKQIYLLLSLINVLKSGRSGSCDLRLIGDVKKAAIVTINSDLSKIKNCRSIRIIDQSPTGLIEKRSQNLLELL